MSTPPLVDVRAATCNPRLVHFDPIGGLLQFFTTSTGSGNEWVQTILFNDWAAVTTVQPELHAHSHFYAQLKPLQPVPEELEEQPEEEPVVEPKPEPIVKELEPVEEKGIKENDPWEVAYSKFPDLINADVKVWCSCPAFKWRGPQYQLETRDTSLFNEAVPFPHTRDPQGINIVCKHLASVIDKFF